MTKENNTPISAIILAGGIGSRFWPLSRSQYPKQVLRLLGSESLIQSTIERLLPAIPLERMLVVTNAAQADVISLELRRKGWENIRLILEPEGRNTAPAVGVAAALLGEENDTGLVAVFPADHFIRDQASLLAALDRGARWAEAGYLVTFGIPPHRPETGYGYIKQGEPLDAPGSGFRAARFIEKPNLARAQGFLDEGGYYWNSGIFLFRRDLLLEAMARHLPELSQGLGRLAEDGGREILAEIYKEFPNISLDHGIMERADNVAMVPVEMGWNDVGTWGALQEIFPKDDQGNVLLGRALDRHSKGCTFYAQNRLVATIGLENVIVVDTPDATLVCHRDRVQEVKDLVADLTRQNMVESMIHPTVFRPWGHYTVMDEGPGYKVKQIEVSPGSRLSLQMHQRRAEHWVVVQGTAKVTIGTDLKLVTSNQSVYIPLKTAHRLENPAAEPLRIIEVQTGGYLEEDDIQRLDDDYSRS
ncbi:MAG: mannose-1-phosphate guanylyltransferase/mannose-6-phosphate isomerase [Deltaproteobacteria bacterium]|nr:mannose-1-phosphate guanylyltransferase/mannose-6-phosphate isomerase [Deltaproteobacteria bacterium]